MKRNIVIVISSILMIIGASMVLAESAVEQTTCPVMGKSIDKSIYVDYNGMRVYLCCNDCREKFNADPEKYIATIKSNGQQPEKLAICPKCGEYTVNGKCCAKDVACCGKCKMHQGSPGCCMSSKK